MVTSGVKCNYNQEMW